MIKAHQDAASAAIVKDGCVRLLSEDKRGDNNKSIKEKIQKGDNYNTVIAFHAI